ncbi:5-(carboxyamino)imidazole ribonucleotide mutase [uncultured Megasphaera sp.]|uniref:5-(carboxyamino)imidazole ribonucleotide mutase n=1 Tax=uncultured Megasphaera sp. TaxID=165188 RepID=UPI0025913D4E|nr:5-(carboxyamino)imidazole ribonucleotide mutase [uncultured Megasphaera sp.]
MKVGVVMGSDSDFPVMKKALEVLKQFGVEYEVLLASAHRTPQAVREFTETAVARGFTCIIAGAGMAAHLPGVVASYTTLPVIGVPLESGPMKGMDALLSIVQMPSGMPVATVAINGAKNAALLAIQIGAASNHKLAQQYSSYRHNMAVEVERKNQKIQEAVQAI